MATPETKATHTPRPWKLTRVPIQSQGGSNTCWKIGPFVACLYDDWRQRERGISEAENEANARLIAAAPATKAQRDQLLEACKNLVASDSDKARVAARAVIAEVEGGEA